LRSSGVEHGLPETNGEVSSAILVEIEVIGLGGDGGGVSDSDIRETKSSEGVPMTILLSRCSCGFGVW